MPSHLVIVDSSSQDYGIYLACIDLSSLRLPTEETGPGPPGAGDDLEKDMEKSTQTWDALEWWLASIVVHAPNSPVAIVGTHDDCGGTQGGEDLGWIGMHRC